MQQKNKIVILFKIGINQGLDPATAELGNVLKCANFRFKKDGNIVSLGSPEEYGARNAEINRQNKIKSIYSSTDDELVVFKDDPSDYISVVRSLDKAPIKFKSDKSPYISSRATDIHRESSAIYHSAYDVNDDYLVSCWLYPSETEGVFKMGYYIKAEDTGVITKGVLDGVLYCDCAIIDNKPTVVMARVRDTKRSVWRCEFNYFHSNTIELLKGGSVVVNEYMRGKDPEFGWVNNLINLRIIGSKILAAWGIEQRVQVRQWDSLTANPRTPRTSIITDEIRALSLFEDDGETLLGVTTAKENMEDSFSNFPDSAGIDSSRLGNARETFNIRNLMYRNIITQLTLSNPITDNYIYYSAAQVENPSAMDRTDRSLILSGAMFAPTKWNGVDVPLPGGRDNLGTDDEDESLVKNVDLPPVFDAFLIGSSGHGVGTGEDGDHSIGQDGKASIYKDVGLFFGQFPSDGYAITYDGEKLSIDEDNKLSVTGVSDPIQLGEGDNEDKFVLKCMSDAPGREIFTNARSAFNCVAVFQVRKRTSATTSINKGLYIFTAMMDTNGTVRDQNIYYRNENFHDDISDICYCAKDESFYLCSRPEDVSNDDSKVYRLYRDGSVTRFEERELEFKFPVDRNTSADHFIIDSIAYSGYQERVNLVGYHPEDQRIYTIRVRDGEVNRLGELGDTDRFVPDTVANLFTEDANDFTLSFIRMRRSILQTGSITSQEVPALLVQREFEVPENRSVEPSSLAVNKVYSGENLGLGNNSEAFSTIRCTHQQAFILSSNSDSLGVYNLTRDTNGKITNMQLVENKPLFDFLSTAFGQYTRDTVPDLDFRSTVGNLATGFRQHARYIPFSVGNPAIAPTGEDNVFAFLDLPENSRFIYRKAVTNTNFSSQRNLWITRLGRDIFANSGFDISGQGTVPKDGPLFTDFTFFYPTDNDGNLIPRLAFCFLCPWARKIYICYLGSSVIDNDFTVLHIAEVDLSSRFGNIINSTFNPEITDRVVGSTRVYEAVPSFPKNVPVAFTSLGSQFVNEHSRYVHLPVLSADLNDSYRDSEVGKRFAKGFGDWVETTTIGAEQFVHNMEQKVDDRLKSLLTYRISTRYSHRSSPFLSSGPNDFKVILEKEYNRMVASNSSKRIYFLNSVSPTFSDTNEAEYPEDKELVKSFNYTDGEINRTVSGILVNSYKPSEFYTKLDTEVSDKRGTYVSADKHEDFESIVSSFGLDHHYEYEDSPQRLIIPMNILSLTDSVSSDDYLNESVFAFWDTMLNLQATTLYTDTREARIVFDSDVYENKYKDILSSVQVKANFYRLPLLVEETASYDKTFAYNREVQFETDTEKYILGKAYRYNEDAYVNLKIPQWTLSDLKGEAKLRVTERSDLTTYDTSVLDPDLWAIGEGASSGMFNLDTNLTPIVKFNTAFKAVDSKVETSVSAHGDNYATPQWVQGGGVSESQEEHYMRGTKVTNDNYKRSVIKIGENYYVNRGAVGVYDGIDFTDFGFVTNPKITKMQSATDDYLLTHLLEDKKISFESPFYEKGLYQYRFVVIYRWIDNNGYEHTSGVATRAIQLDYPLGVDLDVIQDGRRIRDIKNSVNISFTQNKVFNLQQKGTFVTEIYRSDPNSDILRLDRVISENAELVEREITETDEEFSERDTRLFDPAYDLSTENFIPSNVDGIKEFRDNALIWGLSEDKRRVVSSRRFSATSTRPLEFVLAYSRDFPEDVVSVNRLDNLAVVFTQTKLFWIDCLAFITGQGAVNEVQLATGVGPTSAEAVLEWEGGVVWKGAKGFYTLDRGRTVQYIGKAVEDFNKYPCIKAVYSAKNREMTFLLDVCREGQRDTEEETVNALVLNLDFMRWSTMNIDECEDTITDIGLVEGERMMVIKDILHQTGDPGSVKARQRFESTWISLDGIEGYMRLRRLVLLCKAAVKVPLKCWIRYNYDDKTNGLARAFEVGGECEFTQHRIIVDVQKCTSFKLIFECDAGCTFSINGVTIIYVGIGTNANKEALPVSTQ